MDIHWVSGLNAKNLSEIKELESECRAVENLHMKLNWDMLDTRPVNEKNDLLCYEGEQLIAYLGLYDISGSGREIETTGMVRPGFRRKGIFTKLVGSALEECVGRGAERVLLVTERSSSSGMAFAAKSGAVYEHSEYRMRCSLEDLPELSNKGIILRKPLHEDYAVMRNLDSLCFGDGTVSDGASDEKESGLTLVVELNGVFIGKVGILRENGEGYIFGLAILPEYRGRGYGREVLCLSLRLLKAENLPAVNLEVAVENDNALGLYKSCGFREVTVYDYYKIVL